MVNVGQSFRSVSSKDQNFIENVTFIITYVNCNYFHFHSVYKCFASQKVKEDYYVLQVDQTRTSQEPIHLYHCIFLCMMYNPEVKLNA